MGKRLNVSVDAKAMAKIEAIKKVIPDFNLSRLVRDAIMDFEPLDAFNAAMPEGYKVVKTSG